MKTDPVIDEIRAVRRAISEELGHDPRRMLEYYTEIQKRFQDRLVNYGEAFPAAEIRRDAHDFDDARNDDESSTAAR